MKIAYISPAWGTSLHRANALKRLGHQVTFVNPWAWFDSSIWFKRWLYHAGGIGVGIFIDKKMYRETCKISPDLIWVAQGSFFSPSIIKHLRTLNAPIVNYADDDPFSIYNRMIFYNYRKAVPFYDLLVVVRRENVEEAKRAGARKVMQVWRSADEIAHRPRKLTQSERERFNSKVAFIGTYIPGRSAVIAELIKLGTPLSIWGYRWQNAPEWTIIQPHWRGPGLEDDQSYSAAILAAKICLGLVNKRNRDLHTFRSNEIPALGALLCAERTSEHLQLYEEDKEAIFWEDAKECAEKCKDLLVNEEKCNEIARIGHERALHNNLFNEPILASIIKTATG
jgi:spore maturation protein CgeB